MKIIKTSTPGVYVLKGENTIPDIVFNTQTDAQNQEVQTVGEDIYEVLVQSKLILKILEIPANQIKEDVKISLVIMDGIIKLNIVFMATNSSKTLTVGPLFSYEDEMIATIKKSLEESLKYHTPIVHIFDDYETKDIDSLEKLEQKFNLCKRIGAELNKKERVAILEVAKRFNLINWRELAKYKLFSK